MQYDPEFTGKESASNEEVSKSAMLLKTKLGEKGSEIENVTKTVKLEKALDKLTNNNKRCCKTIAILGHGAADGSLDIPYDLPNPNADAPGGLRQLGGPNGKSGWGRDRLADFVKLVKKAFCPDTKLAVTLDACYTAKEGGIAEQLADRGIATTGITGVCVFSYLDEKTEKKTSVLPQPKKGGTSKEESFPAK